MSENQFINTIFIKEKNFDDGDSIIYVPFKVSDFINDLKMIETEEGFANVVLKRRRQPTATGLTHNCIVSKHIPKK
jgi:hypothetical protein